MKHVNDCLPPQSLAVMSEAETNLWSLIAHSASATAATIVRRDSLSWALPRFSCPWFSCVRSVPGEGFPGRRTWSLLVLTGRPKAGKDTVAEHLVDTVGGVGRVAFSDALMVEVNLILGEMCSRLSIVIGEQFPLHRIHEGNKNHPPYRRLLQDWGVIQRRAHGPNYWASQAFEAANAIGYSGAKLVILTGARSVGDLNEAWRNRASVWRVDRPAMTGDEQVHPIETQLDHIPPGMWDGYLVNRDDDLPYLTRQVDLLLPRHPHHMFRSYLKDATT